MKAPESSSSLINSYQKLQQTFHKINMGQNAWSFIGPALWNNAPKEIKRPTNPNAFKHNLKKHYLKELGKRNLYEKLSLLISLVWLCFYTVTNIAIIIIVVIILFIAFIIIDATTVFFLIIIIIITIIIVIV